MSEPVEVSGRAASRAPEAVRPPPGNPRFPLVDGLRALAALGVLFAHVAFASHLRDLGRLGGIFANLDVGVTLFFAISGFLLYRPFVVSDFAGKSISTLAYARRRALRIFPAYWVALTVLAIYPGLPGVFTSDWWRYYLLVQNYSPDPGIRLGGLTQAWSLNIEVAFYLVLPFYAIFARRFLGGADARTRLIRDLLMLSLLAIGSVVLHGWLMASGHQTWLPTLPAFFAWFAAGMGLAVISVLAPMVKGADTIADFLARHSLAAAVLAAVIYLVLGWFIPHDINGFRINGVRTELAFYVGSGVVATLIMTIAVFPRVSGKESVVQRWLGAGTLAWLGLVSYGIFLWHQGVLTALFLDSPIKELTSPWVKFLIFGSITLAVTIPLAAISYYAIERPVLRFKEIRRRGA